MQKIKRARHKDSRVPQPACSGPHSGLVTEKTLRSRNSRLLLLLLDCVSDIYHYVATSSTPRGGEEVILSSICLLSYL